MKPLRIGTRASPLAQWQANLIRARLVALAGIEAELVFIKTSGDRFAQAPVSQIGLKGVFIKEIEDALFASRIDLAVHSMKDVPTEIPRGLAFPAICKREDVRDCLIAAGGTKLVELPRGARVGTSSVRRQAQLRHFRPDLDLRDLRGNVDTRLRKLEHGEYDAVVLAKAGLDRMGWSQRITEVIPTEICLPAAGQGALGIETRASDLKLIELITQLDDTETRTAVNAERALLAALEGGCQVPIGAWARIEQDEFVLEASVLSADGAECVRDRVAGSADQAELLGRELARLLLAAGADRILKLAGRSFGSN